MPRPRPKYHVYDAARFLELFHIWWWMSKSNRKTQLVTGPLLLWSVVPSQADGCCQLITGSLHLMYVQRNILFWTPTLRRKTTIHQVTTTLASSNNAQFPGHNHLLTALILQVLMTWHFDYHLSARQCTSFSTWCATILTLRLLVWLGGSLTVAVA